MAGDGEAARLAGDGEAARLAGDGDTTIRRLRRGVRLAPGGERTGDGESLIRTTLRCGGVQFAVGVSTTRGRGRAGRRGDENLSISVFFLFVGTRFLFFK